MSGQPLPQAIAPPVPWGTTAHVVTVPVVPVSITPPPLVEKATGHDKQADKHSGKHGRHATHVKLKKHAVIKTSVHERILDISMNTSYDVPLAALNAYRNAATRVAYSYPGCHLS